MTEKREKFYTVSARLVFSTFVVLVIVGVLLGASVAINKGPILPLLGIIGAPLTPASGIGGSTIYQGYTTTVAPVVVEATCSGVYPFICQYPYFNYTTGIFTVAISQKSGYNWTSVTVQFVPSNTVYSKGVPILSWAPPAAVNVTGGLLSNATKYVNIPIGSGPVAVGTNITGAIWAKYQITLGSTPSYANISSAIITVKR